MTLEKLQMVAMCNTTPDHKINFLKWWNSSTPSRDARRFLPRPVSENLLGPFLNRCVWYAGVSNVPLMYFRFEVIGICSYKVSGACWTTPYSTYHMIANLCFSFHRLKTRL